MSLRCNNCRVELKNEDLVVLDDFAIIRHKYCFDFGNYGHLVDSIGKFESIRGKLPRFLLNAYKEVIALGDNEKRSSKEITDEEVYASLAYTLNIKED